MDTINKNPQTFQSRLTDKITNGICNLTDQYFELFYQLPSFNEKGEELTFQYREYINAPTMRKTGWFFLVFVLMPCMILFDYTSIKNFIDFLSISAGGSTGSIISFIGGAMFLLFELGIGFLLIQSKGKPILHILSLILAVVMIIIPAYLIYTNYAITENKTSLLYYKTIALIVVSLLIHTLFFLLVSEIWAGIHYYLVYRIKNWIQKTKDPYKKMKGVKTDLQQLYPDFDRYSLRENPEQIGQLINNRAWYLKAKLQNGNTNDDYDLSDYDTDTSYAPKATTSITSEKNTNTDKK